MSTTRARQAALAMARRTTHLFLVLALVSAGTFLLTEIAPGDPAVAVLGPSARAEDYARVETELGLDRPIVERYLAWVSGALRGDLGDTLIPPITPVTELVAARLPLTVELALLAMVVALVVALPLGTWSAYRAGRAAETAAGAASFAVVSVPPFLAALGLAFALVLQRDQTLDAVVRYGPIVGLALAAWALVDHRRARHPDLQLLVFRVAVAASIAAASVTITMWFPDLPRQGLVRITSGQGLGAHLRSIALPVLALGLVEGTILSRILRNDMVLVLQEDFVTTARSKGVSDLRILTHHALRPSSLSLLTMAGISLGRLLGGTVIMETIFRLPGMGSLMVDAVADKDFRVVQAGVLVVSVLYVTINTAVDAGYRRLDPRVAR